MLAGRFGEITDVVFLDNPYITSLLYSKVILMKHERITFHHQVFDLENTGIDAAYSGRT